MPGHSTDRSPSPSCRMAGKSEGGGAGTVIYGLIFMLYAGVAVTLFIYMMSKRSISKLLTSPSIKFFPVYLY